MCMVEVTMESTLCRLLVLDTVITVICRHYHTAQVIVAYKRNYFTIKYTLTL